jgi:deoxycytidine triphosphate deaminase
MILTSKEIEQSGIIQNRSPEGARPTTYDATVGEIILEGITYEGASYALPPRGMVWVVSRERFSLPTNITGLATLRTSWTHNGILALNVGVVDPGWNGPLAASIVNFSSSNFEVRRGSGFLRVLFIRHESTSAEKIEKTPAKYLEEIRDKSARIPSTFLDIKSLANEVFENISGSSLLANRFANLSIAVGFAALIITIIALFIPIAYGVSSEWMSRKVDIQNMEAELQQLRKDLKKTSN